MSREPAPPPGFVELTAAGARAVVAEADAESLRQAIQHETLYAYAARHPLATPLAGRGIAYAVPLPGNAARVVVRHNRHGGLLAPFTGDRFLPPTRAPRELAMWRRLRDQGVRTPEFVAYVTYPAGPLFRRADVATREVANAGDLSAHIMSPHAAVRRRALDATAGLVAQLSHSGARHHDLNVKNVLLVDDGGPMHALVLDIDRVEFQRNGRAVLERNLARLLRSARKWRDRYGAPVTESELSELAERARA